jgi:hypothetical protein
MIFIGITIAWKDESLDILGCEIFSNEYWMDTKVSPDTDVYQSSNDNC